MAEDLQASSDKIEVKLSETVNSSVGGNEKERLTNGDTDLLRKEGNKDEEESASDGDFIKVEKEILVDAKESSHLLNPIVEVEETLLTVNHESGNSEANANFTKMKEKIEDLELQLETVLGKLNSSEAEKAFLKSEFDLANDKLEKKSKRCEELELGEKLMKNQALEDEQRYNLQLESLKEALNATDMKHKELIDVRESFTGLSADLEISRERIKALEEELLSSAGELHKLEELSKHNSTQAELESRKVLDLEKMLELAHVTAKEMEDQMSNLQKELKELYEKFAGKEHIEEALQSTSLELSKFQEKLEISKSDIGKLEQNLASKDSFIHKLTEELNLQKVSEEQLRADVTALENALSASREDLQTKLVNLEELELNLQEQVKEREMVEARFKDQEVQISSLRNDLLNLTVEKETIESTVTDLKTKLLETEELNSQLEAKLNMADQNFKKTDSLLSQASSHKKELEQKMELLEQLHHESRMATEAATKRNLELEGLLQAANADEEVIRSQLKETEMRLAFAEKSNMELEQHLNSAETKYLDAHNEKNELNEKISQLTALLKEVEEENALSRSRFEGYEDKIGQLESNLSKSFSRNSELELQINDLVKKCGEHEEHVIAKHDRNLELEDLFHSSHSRAEDSERRVGELELSLEAANHRTQELEQLLSITEAKHRDVEAESKQYSSKVAELVTELVAYQTRTESLEAVLQAANEKERELTDNLNIVTEERKIIEDLSSSHEKKLYESENQIRMLQNELKHLREKVESVQEELEASNIREKELLEKFRYAGEQLEHHGKTIEEVTARNLELNSLNESLAKDSELKLQQAAASFKQMESEAEELHEKSKYLEEQLAFYKEQAVEATENVASLKAELEANAMKLVSLGNNIEELKQNVMEANLRGEQTVSENELLAMTNSKLKDELEARQQKVNELNELLKSIHAEKEATVGQLASHASTIAQLTDEHSRGMELQFATQSRLKENEDQLHEAIEKYKQKDLEARDLNEKLLALETQLRTYEEQASESAVVAANQKGELEEALVKLQHLEGLTEQLKGMIDEFETENKGLASQNMSLSEELATYDGKLNELQVAFNTVVTEKEDISIQLHASKKELEDLQQLHHSDKEELQSQITTVTKEYSMLSEMHQKERKELEVTKIQFKEKLSEQEASENSLSSLVENLKAELAEKSLMQERIQELEQKLLAAEKAYSQEIESMTSAAAEKDAVLSAKVEEHTSILQEKGALDQQLREILKELDLAQRTIIEQKELDTKKELERQASLTQSLDALESKDQHATLLEKQLEELKQRLLEAENQYKEKVIEESKKLTLLEVELNELRLKQTQTAEMEKKIAELENTLQLARTSAQEVKNETSQSEVQDATEVKSRDLGLDTSTLSRRKSKKRSDKVHRDTEASTVNPNASVVQEHSGATAFKFVLGVGLVSMIIGIILGKRY
ncbi:COP1-interactive protein 1 isoform X1 [Musa acuminata AAA Group]|uniref:COP1-interactive protein 1 isoform X1 n=1 Tax=Musa acuminata AAA Group TaxID=214697 RepID=UPI0031DD8347